MTYFTPYSALIGGALIGLSAVLLLWLNGCLAGISGILGSALRVARGDILWRLLFLAGLILGAGAYLLFAPLSFELRQGYPVALLAIAGFLVGVGTRMSGGCTSGHGICGMARFSRRSIVATLIFMLTGILTVFVLRHVVGVTS